MDIYFRWRLLVKNEDLNNEDDLKNKDNLKNEDDLKNEGGGELKIFL